MAALIYLALRAAAVPGGLGSVKVPYGAGESAGRALGAFGYYVRKLFIPWPQSALVTRLPDPVWTLAALVVLVLLTSWSFRRLRAGQSAWVTALATFVIGVLPSLLVAISGLAEAPVAERYLYVPSLGLVVAFGAMLAAGLAAPRLRRWVALGLATVLSVSAYGALSRSEVWRSDLSLWTDTLERAPDAGLAWGELGKAYLDRGVELDKALDCFQRAVTADNDAFGRAIAYNSMGVIHVKAGRSEEALGAWRKALEENPQYATAHFNLGNYLAQRVAHQARSGVSDYATLEEARSHLSQAVALNPRYAKAALRLVWCDVQRTLFLAAARSPEAPEAMQAAERSYSRLKAAGAEQRHLDSASEMLSQARRSLAAVR